MSAATAEAPAARTEKEVWDEYQTEKELRAERRQKNRQLQRECLDPDVAGDYENRKPRHTYEVTCRYTLPNADGRLEEKTATGKVQAQNENDAWALFCDRVIKHWPSRHNVELTIEKLKK